MSGSPAADDEADDVVDVLDAVGEATPPKPPPPYEYDEAHVDPAARRLDSAYAEAGATRHWSDVIDHLRGGPPTATTLESQTSLDRALQTPVLFRLKLAMAGETPGCRLVPEVDTDVLVWPARLRDVPEPEVQLWRGLASRVEHPAARARLHDLLAERRDGDVRAHAEAAVDAYLELASVSITESGTPFVVSEILVRAWELCRRFQLWGRHQQVQRALLVAADRELATGEHTPGIVLPMLEAAVAAPVRRQPKDATETPAGTPDIDALIEQAIVAYPSDYLLAQTMDLARRRAGSEDERVAVDVRQGEALLAWARDAAGAVRQHRLEVAISYARGRGLASIADEATRDLQRIRPEDLGLQAISASLWLPRDASERYLSGFTRSPMWGDALALFLDSDCPTGSYAALVQQERDLAKISVLRRMFRRTELTHEGRPGWSTSSDEQDQAAEIAWLASHHAREHGRLLAEGLMRMADRYALPDEDTLTDHLSMGGSAHVRLSRSLARSLTLFWRDEHEAAVYLIVPKIEAAARALLLELDEPIYRIQVGSDPGGYGGLHGLLTALENAGMDPDWIYFLKWLLLGHPGANVRNDLTHGLMFDPGPVHTVLVLRAAALMIRLVAPEPGEGAVADRGPDRALQKVRRPVDAPYAWPTRQGVQQRVILGLASSIRTVAHLLDDVANKMAP